MKLALLLDNPMMNKWTRGGIAFTIPMAHGTLACYAFAHGENFAAGLNVAWLGVLFALREIAFLQGHQLIACVLSENKALVKDNGNLINMNQQLLCDLEKCAAIMKEHKHGL